MTEDHITEISRRLGRACKKKRIEVVTAESCTGGGAAAAITRVSGSAKWFDRGFVTYSNSAKKQMLGVRQKTLGDHGAVSEEVAREMAAGALKKSGADVSASKRSESAVIAICAWGSAPSRTSTSPGAVRTVMATPASGTVMVAEDERSSRRRDGSRSRF